MRGLLQEIRLPSDGILDALALLCQSGPSGVKSEPRQVKGWHAADESTLLSWKTSRTKTSFVKFIVKCKTSGTKPAGIAPTPYKI